MINQFSRTELLFGSEGMAKLSAAHIAVFGIGGVGGHAVDALARSGVGALTLIDNDEVSLTNVNRQMVATLDTVGQPKVEAARARIRSIHPECRVTALQKFFLPLMSTQSYLREPKRHRKHPLRSSRPYSC